MEVVPLPAADKDYVDGDGDEFDTGFGNEPNSSKKDKRQRALMEKLERLTAGVVADRDRIFRQQLTSLQMQLSELHDGTNAEYVAGVQQLEREHDEHVANVRAFIAFMEERVEHEYAQEVAAAEEEFASSRATLKSSLLRDMQAKRRRLREDKELLDIASDGSMLSHVLIDPANSAGSAGGVSGLGASVGGGVVDRRRLRHRRHGADSVNGSAIAGSNGADGSSGGLASHGELGDGQSALEDLLSGKPRRGLPTSSLNLGLSAYSFRDKEREKDARSLERQEREREKAVERGLAGATDTDAQDDISMIRRMAAQTNAGSIPRKRR